MTLSKIQPASSHPRLAGPKLKRRRLAHISFCKTTLFTAHCISLSLETVHDATALGKKPLVKSVFQCYSIIVMFCACK